MGEGKRHARNLAMEELIGRKVKVNAHTADGLVGIEGMVLDETRNTITVGIDRGKVVVPKKGAKFSFPTSDGCGCVLDGDRLIFRPEDRIKRCERVTTVPVQDEDDTHDH